MPEYKYTAIDRNGAQASGKIEAANDEQARQKLMAKGLMVTTLANDGGSAKPAATPAAPSKGGFTFGAKVSQNDVTLMTRQLATLIVPLRVRFHSRDREDCRAYRPAARVHFAIATSRAPVSQLECPFAIFVCLRHCHQPASRRHSKHKRQG